jgi:hypothetical protein
MRDGDADAVRGRGENGDDGGGHHDSPSRHGRPSSGRANGEGPDASHLDVEKTPIPGIWLLCSDFF